MASRTGGKSPAEATNFKAGDRVYVDHSDWGPDYKYQILCIKVEGSTAQADLQPLDGDDEQDKAPVRHLRLIDGGAARSAGTTAGVVIKPKQRPRQ